MQTMLNLLTLDILVDCFSWGSTSCRFSTSVYCASYKTHCTRRCYK